MNRAYRLVWNETSGTWVAVAEIARARGKGNSRAARAAVMAFLTALGLGVAPVSAEQAATTVVPASGKTNAYISANGVPVVNIETANASGLSHNRFTRYDVETIGMVLNNGNNTQVARQSQLAGQVISNLNLVQEAKVILNEVVSTNRSTLAGFTEVLGGKADVVVANPNGITCSGCGFINTDRVTLTTGMPNVAGDGSLGGFTVNRGDVLIQGQGANASTQQIFDLVARSVKVDGSINTAAGGSLGIVAGNNTYDYAGRNVTATGSGSGPAPAFAVDSTALGGMYAGRIRIIATEAGVGVRMLGEAAASADDFTLTSAGRIELQSVVSAKRDASVSTSSATGSQDLFVNGAGAKVSAERNLSMSATSGQVKLTEGELYAANNLTLTAGTLTDATASAKTRFAGANSTVTSAGAANIDGGVWGAGSALSGTYDSFTIGASGGKVYAGTTLGLTTVNNMSLGTAGVRSTGNLTLTANDGAISTAAGTGQGVQTTGGNLSLTAGNGLTNAGIMTSDLGSVTVRVNGTVSNSGTLHAKTTLDVADKTNGGTQSVVNTGTLIAGGNFTSKAASFTNQAGGKIQGATGTTLTATSLTNAGTFVASDTVGQSGTFTLSSLNNSGTLQSAEDLIINVSGSLANSGKLLATDDLSVLAGTAALAVTNTAPGVIQAGDVLTLNGSNATFDTQSGTVLGNTVAATLASLANAGTLQSNAGMTLSIGSGLSNAGTLLAKTTLTSTSGNLVNSGTLQADQGSTITTSGALTNSGLLIASDSATLGGTLNAGTLSNTGTGTIQSAQNLAVNVSGATLTNAGEVIATNNLTVTSTGSGLNLTNQSGGYLQAGNAFTSGGTAVALNNNSGGYLLGNQLLFTLASLTNGGTIQGGTAVSSFNIIGALNNTGTLTTATSGTANSTVSANSLDNSGILQSGAGISLAVTNLVNNAGTLFSAKNLTTNSGSLSNSGTLQTNQDATITTGTLINTGNLIASGTGYDGNLSVSTLSNTGTGTIQSAQSLAVNVSGATVTNAGKVIAANDLTVTSTGSGLTLTNQSGGYLQAGAAAGDALTIGGTAVALSNNSGGYLLGDQLLFTLASLTNGGIIQGGAAASSLNVSGTVTNTGTLALSSIGTGSGTVTADTINNSGTLQSSGAATLNVASLLSNTSNVLTGGALTVRGTDSGYDVTSTGLMQAGGLLDIKGQAGGNGVNITVGSGGTLLGDSVDLRAGTLTMSNNGMLSSNGNMTVSATAMTFGGTSSRIVAATSGSGTASVVLATGFTNPGAIHSGATLNFSAPWINNSSTGGFSALGTLNLSATGGDLYNAGALYAGSQLNASTTGMLTNVASTGTIDSSGSLSISAATFLNNNTVAAVGNITITATTFRNETPGGDTRQWTGVLNDSGTVQTYYSGKGYHGCGCVDQTEWWDYRQTWNVDQYYAGAVPTIKPQIIGGGTVTIQSFTSGTNLAGVISGSTVNLFGSGTFTNDDLSLQRKNYTKTWTRHIEYIAAGPAKYHDETRNVNESFTTSTISSTGAGIYATTLNASGFSLVVAGSPYSASATPTSESGASGTSLSGSVTGTTGSNGTSQSGAASGTSSGTGVTGTSTSSGAPAISFGGLVIALPTNPNGYFVVSQSPGAQYLVETNPLFKVGANFVGSDYMSNRYGYNPDTIIKRLGDSNYEAYLVKQQLINQIGKNIISGYDNEAAQMQRLWDQAVSEGKRLGLTFGKPLTESQITNLKEDVIWMVETTVAGQKVLAPVVYLAASTKSGVEKGSVIAAENVNLDLKSVSNTGGTISGSKTLNITSQGDIINTSGTIKGGDVTLKSTTGSIKNETLVEGSGGGRLYATTVGKTAGITATGNLDMGAKQDITVKGGQVKAGGDASLDAGGKISFETVVNKTTNTTSSKSGNALLGSTETTTTTAEKNIGSTLESGGNLKLKSGGDTTIKGSEVKIGGNLDVDTGGDFKVLAVQDKTTTRTEKTTSGLGVGGGIAGTEKVTTDSFTGKNVGSTVTVGGNAKVKSEGEMTLQGSDMSVAGNAGINAKKGVNVLDGLDEQRTTTKTETTTFLKMESGGQSGSGSGSSGESRSGQGYGKAGGKADAKAEASGDADFKFSETTTTVTKSGSNTSVGSNLKVGGDLNVGTEGTAKVRGSNVEAGGNLGVNANNVEVTTGRNETWSTTTTDRVSTGIFNEGKSGAESGAEGQARGGTVGNNANGKAGASAGADGTTTIGARVEKEESSSYTLTNSGSTLKSGGDMNIKAKNDATFVGSSAESGGDMNIDAKNITNKAAQDITLNTESKTRHTAGLYVDGQAGAEAKANGQAGRLGNDPASGEAKGEAKADASAGVRYKNEQSTSTEGSATQVTSGFKAGGSITRTAADTITDQGTQMEAGGNINQSAREIKEIEANNSTFSSKNSSSHDAKIGVGADAGASAGANSKGKSEFGADAGAGFRAKYKGEIASESEGSTTAVTTRYKAGGNINSTSQEKTTLIGTQMEAGGNVNLEAGSLEFKAAKDTTSKSGTTHEIDAKLKIDVAGGKGGSLEASYEGSGENEKTSTARTGSINAGGNLNIKTKGDSSFEGTQLESGGDASIKSGGTVDFKAARDTTESSNKSGGVSVEVSGSKKSKGGSIEGEYAQSDSASSKAQTASIKSGGKLDVSAGKDANFEGTGIKSTGDASVEAGGNVNLKAATSSETSTAFHVEGGASGEKGKEGSEKGGSISGGVEHMDKAESKGSSIESDGKVSIKGKTVVNQEAGLKGEGGTEVTGNVIKQKAENHDIAVGLDVGVAGE